MCSRHRQRRLGRTRAHTSEPEPAISEPEPAISEPEPAISEPEPAISEPEPAISEPEPAISEPEPGNTEPEPDTGTQAVDAGPDALECPRDFGHVPFTLAFSVDWAKESSFEADCNVDAIDGPEPRVVRLACLATEGEIYPEPEDFALDVEGNLLQGTPESLELGSSVRFRYSWLTGFNTENYAYSISATELTSGRTAGDPLLGGVHGDEWSYVARVFDPVGLTLSDATCTNEPNPDWEDFDCIRSTFHDLVFRSRARACVVLVSRAVTNRPAQGRARWPCRECE